MTKYHSFVERFVVDLKNYMYNNMFSDKQIRVIELLILDRVKKLSATDYYTFQGWFYDVVYDVKIRLMRLNVETDFINAVEHFMVISLKYGDLQ